MNVLCSVLLSLWLSHKCYITLSTNKRQLARERFPAVVACCVRLLWILIGSLNCLPWCKSRNLLNRPIRGNLLNLNACYLRFFNYDWFLGLRALLWVMWSTLSTNKKQLARESFPALSACSCHCFEFLLVPLDCISLLWVTWLTRLVYLYSFWFYDPNWIPSNWTILWLTMAWQIKVLCDAAFLRLFK